MFQRNMSVFVLFLFCTITVSACSSGSIANPVQPDLHVAFTGTHVVDQHMTATGTRYFYNVSGVVTDSNHVMQGPLSLNGTMTFADGEQYTAHFWTHDDQTFDFPINLAAGDTVTIAVCPEMGTCANMEFTVQAY